MAWLRRRAGPIGVLDRNVMEKWEKLCRETFTVRKRNWAKSVLWFRHQSRVVVDQKQMPAMKEERERN